MAVRNVQVPGFEPLHAYVEQCLDLGRRLMVCAPCTEYYCGLQEGAERRIFDEAEFSGLVTALGYVGQDGTTVTF